MPRRAAGFKRPLTKGNAKAQDALGYMYYNGYYNGEGVPLDYTEAAHWYRKGAEQGDTLAEQGLAYMYVKGQGVEQDDTQAVAWYQKAAEQGDPVAQTRLG